MCDSPESGSPLSSLRPSVLVAPTSSTLEPQTSDFHTSSCLLSALPESSQQQKKAARPIEEEHLGVNNNEKLMRLEGGESKKAEKERRKEREKAEKAAKKPTPPPQLDAETVWTRGPVPEAGAAGVKNQTAAPKNAKAKTRDATSS